MLNLKTAILSLCFFTFFFIGLFVFTATGVAGSAKEKYLAADACYKKLRHSSARQKKATEWLNCISRYEIIYRLYPESSWAPAGMYKAAQLYRTLSRLSGKDTYQMQSNDLLARIRNKYPTSAYGRRAESLLKSANIPPGLYTATKKSGPAPKNLTPKTGLIKKKDHNRNVAALERKKKDPPKKQGPVKKSAPAETKASGDATINDLRFWSNPEYTRIVVNADKDRDYSHRLLKNDPDIDKPFQRLYIDIEHAKLGKGVADYIPINDNLLKQARAGQYLPHTVRVVVDIKLFENYKIFSLKDPFRIVIDVWGKGSNGGGTAKSGSQLATSGKPQKFSRVTTDNLKSSDIARQLALGVNKIVIDPGHGGADPGAPGYFKGIWEKDIVLKMAKNLAVILRDRLNCTVLLTRSTDKKLTLEERTAIANTKRADLFISLHCNAAKNRNLRGIETYFLNLATDNQAISVAARENATSEKNISDLAYILSDLMKHTKIEESTRLANIVQTSVVAGMGKHYSDITDLGVKQAPFYVLLGARMPSILVETSFISNKKECKRLMSSSYQTAICNAIADGVTQYIAATNPKQL
ncbi:N-acetylmuramoyl-L-alanine amidase [Desulfobacula sp.]|uniref:N-acetylmuramoyl-L-alanine amidase n=1 Tax=Desulfobacula sp. TaxID=2593537 RepID=UPI002623DC96|nr:N-acetylmuramoyl-L-alanine amidase [Desulfobacula sp.]